MQLVGCERRAAECAERVAPCCHRLQLALDALRDTIEAKRHQLGGGPQNGRDAGGQPLLQAGHKVGGQPVDGSGHGDSRRQHRQRAQRQPLLVADQRQLLAADVPHGEAHDGLSAAVAAVAVLDAPRERVALALARHLDGGDGAARGAAPQRQLGGAQPPGSRAEQLVAQVGDEVLAPRGVRHGGQQIQQLGVACLPVRDCVRRAGIVSVILCEDLLQRHHMHSAPSRSSHRRRRSYCGDVRLAGLRAQAVRGPLIDV
mmetsp:Transcript_25876/g.65092  ORF Transcript_25876/g.65092 Transcript_25876/m.65092 type:complete len:258 (-) Transcript_25876:580-1353(-)